MGFSEAELNAYVRPFSGGDPETDIILYFTDNENEPKSLNIRRCIESDTEFTGNPFSYTGQNLEDFINACPRVPSAPITIDYAYDLSDDGVMLESQFTDTDGLIFAYQNIYRNGYVSSLSEYSKVAYPETIANLGARSKEEVLIENRMSLLVPSQGKEVQKIRILFKEGDGGTWKIIDEVSADIDEGLPNYTFTEDNTSSIAGTYRFYNNETFPVLPLNEASKHFDKLPARAQAQGVSGNRLMYGNYEEGFDPVLPSAISTVIYNERLQDLVTFDLTAEPIVAPNGEGSSTGFVLSTEGLPVTIASGLYEININMTPRRNLHVFNSSDSYSPSQHATLSGETSLGASYPNVDNTVDGAMLATEPHPGLDEGIGDFFSTTSSLPMFMTDSNLGAASGVWDPGNTNATGVKIGTTPAAPLILGVQTIPISLIININESITRPQLVQVISSLLTGVAGTSNATLHAYIETTFNVSVVYANGNEGVADAKVEIKAGLDSGDEFSQESSLSQLISTFKPFIGQGLGGFFIVNKADAEFAFDSVSSGNTINLNEFQKAFQLRIKSLDLDNSPDAILTCFPAPAKGFQSPIVAGGDFDRELTMPDNPWRIIPNYDSGGGLAGQTGSHIVWPQTDYANLKGFDGDELYTQRQVIGLTSEGPEEYLATEGGINDPREQHPVRIGKWLALNKEDVIDYTKITDFYSAKFTASNDPEASVGGRAIQDLGPGENPTVGLRLLQVPELLKTETFAYTIALGSFGITSNVSMSATWAGYFNDFFLTPSSDLDYPLSVVDGDCGPGGRRSLGSPFSGSTIDIEGAEEGLEVSVFTSGDTVNLASGVPENWVISNQADFLEGAFNTSGATQPKHNRYGSIWNTSLFGHAVNMPYIDAAGRYLEVTDAENTSHPSPIKEGAYDALYVNELGITSNFASLLDTELSFKTRATHDFGIVYYDKRGRRGAVNKLKSVYVPGYSDTERPDQNKGSVSIKLKINHVAPEWADRYKIFYSNRNNTKRFIQYMSGGAYTEKGVNPSKSKIYVSLNYLQGNNISYAKGFGARTQDTDEPTLYRYSPGDKLRVISYYNTDSERVFANDNVVFSVVGVETLTDNMEEHPLYGGDGFTVDNATKKLQRNGQFVVLQENPQALGTGFSSLDIDAANDKWGDRCLFEIISPNKEAIDEAQPYFETSYGGGIVESNNGAFLIHEQPNGGHIIDEGDVFFRGIPANIRPFENGVFTDLIETNDSEEDISESNFLPYYAETEGLTDLHRSVAKGYGKPNFVDPEAFKKRMQASVIFSEITDPNTFKLKHTSFPSNEEISFHLPEKHGALNYIVGEDEYITSLQENKVAVVPVDRSITSTAQGRDTLNISDKVLNGAKFFFGDGGPSGNPESVTSVDGFVYFVDKRNKRISRVSPGGTTVENISELGMSEYFKRHLTSLTDSSLNLDKNDIRIVTGFDPLSDELLVSFLRPDGINAYNATDLVSQPMASFVGGPLQTPLAKAEINSEELPMNTIAFDHKGGKAWKTRYSFSSTNYAKVNNNLISFKPFGSDFVWEHGKATLRNSFHGYRYLSMLKIVSNSSGTRTPGPSATKVYKALSLDGTSAWPSIVKTEKEKGRVSSFKDYEGTKYSAMPKSEGFSTSNVRSLGDIKKATLSYPELGSENNFLFNVGFYKPINKGAVDTALTTEYFLGKLNETYKIPQVLGLEFVDDYNIVFNLGALNPVDAAALTALEAQVVNQPLIHRSKSAIYGDNFRGKHVILSLYNNSPEPVDLYSVNLEVSASNLDVTT